MRFTAVLALAGLAMTLAACAPQAVPPTAAPAAKPPAQQAAPTSQAAAPAAPAAQPTAVPIPMKMNIGKAVAYAGLMIAQDNGMYTDAGIKVEPAGQMLEGSNIMQAMLGGSFAFTGTSGVGWFAALAQGVPISAVAVYAGGGDRVGLLGRKGTDIKTAKDLVGKTVGSPSRNISQEALYAYLAADGVDAKSVKIVPVTDEALPAALQSGSIDAGVTVEPYVSAVESGGTGYIVARLGKWVGGGYNVIVFPTQYVQQNPDAVERFVTAHARAMQFVRQKPKEATQVVGKWLTNLEPERLTATMNYLTWDPRFTADAMKSFQDEMQLQNKLGWIDKQFDLKSVTDSKFLDSVQKKHPEYFSDLK